MCSSKARFRCKGLKEGKVYPGDAIKQNCVQKANVVMNGPDSQNKEGSARLDGIRSQ